MPFPSTANYFQAGVGGGSTGRPKGRKNWKTYLQDLLDVEVEEDGVTMTVQEQIARQIILKAKKGNDRAVETIMDRTDGKPLQEVINHTVEDKLSDLLGKVDEIK